MRFLILHTDYSDFSSWLYQNHPGLESQSYETQMRFRNESLFYVADFYSSNLRKLGHEARDIIHTNNMFLQETWASEHGVRLSQPSVIRKYISKFVQTGSHILNKLRLSNLEPLLPQTLRMLYRHPQNYAMLSAQIKSYKPDVLLNKAMHGVNDDFISAMKPYVRFVIGQHAATSLSRKRNLRNFKCYDLIISSYQPTVEFFKKLGIPAELKCLGGFEPKVLSSLRQENQSFDITFVGSFDNIYKCRVKFLETLYSCFPQIKIWGPGINYLPINSPIRMCYSGAGWGLQMYQILHRSKITLNHHEDNGLYAHNMRLFEATGVGTLLLTDSKENLNNMFEPGKEVIAYRNAEECAELIKYYLEHDEAREAIAHAGQQRTLRDHTYYQRMQELLDIVHKYF